MGLPTTSVKLPPTALMSAFLFNDITFDVVGVPYAGLEVTIPSLSNIALWIVGVTFEEV